MTPKEYYYYYAPGRVIVKSDSKIKDGTIVNAVKIFNDKHDTADRFQTYDLLNYKLLTEKQVVIGKLTDWKEFE